MQFSNKLRVDEKMRSNLINGCAVTTCVNDFGSLNWKDSLAFFADDLVGKVTVVILVDTHIPYLQLAVSKVYIYPYMRVRKHARENKLSRRLGVS